MSNIRHLGAAKKCLLWETLGQKVSTIGNKWLLLETWERAGRVNIALAELPPALEKRFRATVANHYEGDIQTALAGFLELHEKHATNGRAKMST